MQDFSNLLRLLLENKIEFVLIGGMAAVVHGASQVTEDIDICAAIDPKQVEKLRACLRELHPKHRMTSQKLSFIEFPEETGNLKNLYLQTDWGILDVIGTVTGVGNYDAVLKSAVEIELFGSPCRVLGIEGLISAKQALGREKDLATVRELKAIRKLQEEKGKN